MNEGYPFQKIPVDFVGPLQPSSKGNTHNLTVKDTFSRWLEAYPTKDTTSKNIALILSRNILCRFGMPEQIHSDQGPNFVGELVRHVYESLEIQFTTTPAYNPKSNPVERSHKDLGRMLRVLSYEIQDDWGTVLPAALYALRTAVNRSTQLSPFRILFGREA